MQQYLPLAVLKLKLILHKLNFFTNVATVLTACGIETLEALTGWFGDDLFSCNSTYRLRYWNSRSDAISYSFWWIPSCNSTYRLRYWNKLDAVASSMDWKRCNSTYRLRYWNSFLYPLGINLLRIRCNSTYRLRYWNMSFKFDLNPIISRCNSTYRLRYWNWTRYSTIINTASDKLQQYLPLAVLKQSIDIRAEAQAMVKLQQYLPLAVLKQLVQFIIGFICVDYVATVLTACGIETGNISNIETGSGL